MAATAFYLLPIYEQLAADEAESLLGAVVRNYRTLKTQESILRPKSRTESKDYPILDNVKARATTKNTRSWDVSLDQLASHGRDKDGLATIELSSKRLYHRRMQNVQSIFDTMLADKEDQARADPWIRTFRTSKTACMIIGFLMCDDGSISETNKEIRSIRNSLVVPVLEVASAFATGVPIPISVGDPGFKIAFGSEKGGGLEGDLPGPQIIGVEYRWIVRNPMSRKVELQDTGPISKSQFSGGGNLSGEDAGMDQSRDHDTPEAAEKRRMQILAGEMDVENVVLEEMDWDMVIEEECGGDVGGSVYTNNRSGTVGVADAGTTVGEGPTTTTTTTTYNDTQSKLAPEQSQSKKGRRKGGTGMEGF